MKANKRTTFLKLFLSSIVLLLLLPLIWYRPILRVGRSWQLLLRWLRRWTLLNI
jgi:hypothetical protein